MAQITLELDDKTAAGFAGLVKNIQTSDQTAAAFSQTTNQLAEAVNVLTQQQAQQIQATQQQAIVVHEIDRSFMEWSNTLVEFTRNVRSAAGATADWIGDKLQWAAAKAGVDATTAALTALAAKALGIGAPLLGAKLAAKGLEAAFDATGKKIVAIEGPASAAAKRLAAEINSGFSTAEEVMERTGKTMEDLGLKVESNADRMGVAFRELRETASTHLGGIWDAFMAPIPILEQAWKTATEEIDAKFSEMARNTIENTEAITDAINEWMGLDAQHVREQKKFFEQEERLKEVRAEYQAFEADLEKQISLRRELGQISRIATQEDLDAAIAAEEQKRADLIATDQWTQEAKENHFARLKALRDRELSLEQEKLEKRKQYEREAAEHAKKQHEDYLTWRERREEQSAARRKAIRDEENAYIETLRVTRENAEATSANRKLELMKSRIEREEKDEEKKHAAILELEKQAILNRAAADTSATEDRIEQAQIAARAIEEIRDAELQSQISYEQKAAELAAEAKEKTIALAREKFDTEVALLRKKLEEEKRLAGGGTQSELGKLAGSFSKEKVRDEIVANRLQAGARAGRNQDGRKLTEAEIRRMVMREMQTGQLDQKEVQSAQLDLVQQSAIQGRATGQLGKKTAQGLYDAATALQRQNAEIERQAQEIEQIGKVIKGESSASQGRTERLRAQRRSVRG